MANRAVKLNMIEDQPPYIPPPLVFASAAARVSDLVLRMDETPANTAMISKG